MNKSKALFIAYDYGECGDYFIKCLSDEFAEKKGLDLRVVSFKELFENKRVSRLNVCFYSVLSLLKLFFTLMVRGRRSKLLYKMRNLKYKGVDVGVFIFSSYLRSSSSEGYMKISYNFIKFYLSEFTSLLSKFRILNKVMNEVRYDNIYFYCTETVYHYGAIRDFLAGKGIKELKFDKYKEKYILSTNKTYTSSFNEKEERLNLSEKQIIEGLSYLKSLVYRKETYSYMKDVDISTSTNFDYSTINLRDKIAVIFMHAVSDDQYVYGPDGFLDLHDWLMSSVQVLRECGYIVLIKPHPVYFPKNVKQFYIADHRYLVHLMGIFNSYIPFDSKKLLNTDMDGVFFLPANLSLIEMKRNIGEFLVLTHHGSIAVEAAYLRLPALVSTSSPYSEHDSFVSFYDDRNTLKCQLAKENIENNIKDSSNTAMMLLGRYVYNRDLSGKGRSSSYYFRKTGLHNGDGRKANLDIVSEKLKNLSSSEKKELSERMKLIFEKEFIGI